MVFEVPVLLSAVFTGWALTCGGLIPALADAGVGWLLSAGWRRRAERWGHERAGLDLFVERGKDNWYGRVGAYAVEVVV